MFFSKKALFNKASDPRMLSHSEIGPGGMRALKIKIPLNSSFFKTDKHIY